MDGNEFEICVSCGESLPRSSFRADNRKRNGLFSWCRPCVNNAGERYREKNREKYLDACRRYYRKRKQDDPHFDEKVYARYKRLHKDKNLKKNYGITLEEYETMLAEQGGICGICCLPERMSRSLSVDHDHVSGKVRGLLCHRCNAAIGYVRESPLLAVAVAEYLTCWQG